MNRNLLVRYYKHSTVEEKKAITNGYYYVIHNHVKNGRIEGEGIIYIIDYIFSEMLFENGGQDISIEEALFLHEMYMRKKSTKDLLPLIEEEIGKSLSRRRE